MAGDLIILGASVRAAAFSALRAGLKPWCADLFADLDLRAKCPAVAVDASRYPNVLAAMAREAPPGPWMYTGGLENRPRLIRRISRERTLWGTDDMAVAKVRDPFALRRALAEAGVRCPEVRRPDRPPSAGRWLVKPVAGSGGAGIRFADERPMGARHFLQEFRDGEPRSAVFVATDADTRLVGVTRQLVGEGWLHAPAFRYCGSIGPLAIAADEKAAWLRLGRAVASFGGLRGVFGIDAVVDEGVPWPVEVNPRYTASVEVLEYVGESSSTIRLWEPWLQPMKIAGAERRPSSIVGKAVYHAATPLIVIDGPWSDLVKAAVPVTKVPPFADIPAVGQRIPAGAPVLTFFARAGTPETCASELRATAVEIDRRLLKSV